MRQVIRHAFLVWTIFVLGNLFVLGQGSSCAFDQIREDFEHNEEYMQEIQTMEHSIIERTFLQGSSSAQGYELGTDTVTYTVPVVVHVVHRSSASYGQHEHLTESDIHAQLAYVNDAFQNANGLSFDNPHAGTDVGIKFCLASRDPQGNATTGIIYHEDDVRTYDYVVDWGGPVMPTYQWNPYEYMNIYIVYNISGGYYAYSNLASQYGKAYDGLVLEYDVTPGLWCHEIGHYLNLYHTFEDGTTSSCASNDDCRYEGDLVCDTPPHEKHYGECNIDLNTCNNDHDDLSDYNPFRPVDQGGLGGQNDPVFNFMSYDCYENFTEGQRKRMRDALVNIRGSLLRSEVCIPLDNMYDAGITAITSADGLSCSEDITPKFELKNYGIAALQSVKVDVLLDGIFQYNYTWTGNLASNTTTEVALPQVNIADGNNVLCVLLSDPNNQQDAYETNNIKLQDILYKTPQQINVTSSCDFNIYSNYGEYNSGVTVPLCDNYQGGDIWFVTQIPTSGHLIIDTEPMDIYNAGMAVYSGTCEELTLIECNEDSGTGYMPKIEMYGVAGEDVFIRLWEKSNNVFGKFGLCAYEGSGAIPDFEITNATISTDMVSPYTGVWCELDINNFGNGVESRFEIGWYLSKDMVWDESDIFVDNEVIHDLAANSTKEDGEMLYIPNFLWAGDWYLLIVADHIETAQESNEYNNVVALPIQIQTDNLIQADLLAEDESVFPHTVTTGGLMTMGANYKNVGSGLAGGTFLRYYISTDTIWSQSDIYFTYSWQYDGLPPNANEVLYKQKTLPSAVGQGDWYMLFICDENRECLESDESNNVSHVPFTVDNSFYVTYVDFTAYLEGHYKNGLLETGFQDQGIFPLLHPYRSEPYDYKSVECVDADDLPAYVVDWVVIEARQGIPLDQDGAGTEMVERRAAFITSNGSIVDIDGVSPVAFYDLIQGEDYYFAVRHKTHLDIMTKSPITVNSSISYDFTKHVEQAYGTDKQKVLPDGAVVMYGGDYDGSGQINNLDFNLWTLQSALIGEYVTWDGDGNGVVNNIDFNFWQLNRSKIGLEELYLLPE